MSENDDNNMQYTQAPDDGPEYEGEVQDYNNSGKGQGTGFGIASLVLGIVSIVVCCIWYISIPAGILAIVFGIMQIVKNEKRGMAIAGIICSAVGVIASIVVLIYAAYMVSSGLYQDIMNQMGVY